MVECCCEDSSCDSWGEEDERDTGLRIRKFKTSFFLTQEQICELDKCKRGVNLYFNIEIDDSEDESRKQTELGQILDFYEKYWSFHGKEVPSIEWDPFGRPYGVDACGRTYGYDQLGLPFGYDECGIPFGYDRNGRPFGRRTYGLPRIPVNMKLDKKFDEPESSKSTTTTSQSQHSPRGAKGPRGGSTASYRSRGSEDEEVSVDKRRNPRHSTKVLYPERKQPPMQKKLSKSLRSSTDLADDVTTEREPPRERESMSLAEARRRGSRTPIKSKAELSRRMAEANRKRILEKRRKKSND